MQSVYKWLCNYLVMDVSDRSESGDEIHARALVQETAIPQEDIQRCVQLLGFSGLESSTWHPFHHSVRQLNVLRFWLSISYRRSPVARPHYIADA